MLSCRRLSCLILSLVGLFVSSVASAHEGHDHPPVKHPEAEVFKPTPMPDRIILSWTGETTTTMTVNWRTDLSASKALAQIAVAEDGPLFKDKAQNVPATTQRLKSDISEANYHTARFTGLTPKTKYVYRVGDGENWSEWFQFRTASNQPEPFSFVYFGDAQNDVRSMWSRIVREAYSDAPKAAFLLHAGDLINRANADAEWGGWFSAGGFLNAMVPNIPAPGNHEYLRDRAKNTSAISVNWRPQFALPEHGPAGLEETVYFTDFQGTRIVTLNSNEKVPEQAVWLEKVLSTNPQKWTIVTYHHPVYSASKRPDNALLQTHWQPLFDKYHVDLALQGHDHSYIRTDLRTSTNLPTGANVRDPQSGTVYVVSVSGPKMYPLGHHDFTRRAAEDTQLYQIIHINGDELKYEARTAKGTVYDAFLLKKRPGQANELIDQIPPIPENRRQTQKKK